MRPLPPADLFDIGAASYDKFIPAPDLAEWLPDTFIAEDASLNSGDHAHLCFAVIGGSGLTS